MSAEPRMATWLGILYERLRSSLWFVPGLMTAVAAALALLCESIDQSLTTEDDGADYLYHGEIESIRTLLSTVAGSMITVAGVSFSVTMVALSLASSQFGPRLLVNFMRDPGNQVVLGGFIATFLFCLLALGSTPHESGEVVSLSVTVALVLAVGSLMLLIYFIHHIATSMQADYVIRVVAQDLDRSLREVFEDTDEPPDPGRLDEGGQSVDVPARSKGYLQGVDLAGLVEIAAERDLRLRVLRRPGQYVTGNAALVRVYGLSEASDSLARRLRKSFLIGGSRTADQDVEYGVHQLVEIALRALSPGINDAYTAMACIDHLSGILAEVAPLPLRPPIRRAEDGQVRLTMEQFDFVGVLDASFDQIRQSSVRLPSVNIRILEALARVAAAAEDPQRLDAVARQARLVREGSRDQMLGSDREVMEGRYRRVMERVGDPGG